MDANIRESSFRKDGGDAIASLAPFETEIARLVELVVVMSKQDSAPVASLQKLAGKLRFTQAAIMRRFG